MLELKTLQFTTLNFDASFQEIFSCWYSGGSLLLINEDIHKDAAKLLKFIRAEKINRIFMPFVMLSFIMELMENAPEEYPDLQDIMTAGEQLQINPFFKKYFSENPYCNLHNYYGPTESHVVSSFLLKGHSEQWPLLPPIGKPIDNIQLYILDNFFMSAAYW